MKEANAASSCKISLEDTNDDDSAKLLPTKLALTNPNKMPSKKFSIGRRLSHRKWFQWAPAASLLMLVLGVGGSQSWPQLFARPQSRQEMMPLMLSEMPQQFGPPPPQMLQPANVNQNLLLSPVMGVASEPTELVRNQDQSQNQIQSQSQSQKEDMTTVGAVESKPAKEEPKMDLSAKLDLGAKLVDLALDRVVNASKSHQTEKLAAQMLKPRKEVAQQHQHHKHAVSAEEQIISQHARLHLTGQHQRLLPTKQRDHRVSSLLTADGHHHQDRSPLAGLLGQLKSAAGISSRQSIVKAISDNKLARTLSTVGKSISGNKYVAGAAAASALAALGLTVSKFLTPYLYAGGYSKLADPMLGSSSLMQPIFERNNAAADALAYAGSQPSASYAARPAYFEGPYASATEPSSGPPEFQRLVPVTRKPASLYFTYRPSSLDTNGHYSDFYQQEAAPATEQQQQPDQFLASASSDAGVSASLNPPPPRRSGPLARIRLDEATRRRLYELLVQQQQQQAYAVELAPQDWNQPGAKLTRSAALQLEPADSPEPTQQQRPQQGQSVPKTIPSADAYLIIKPQKVANGPDVFSLTPQAAQMQVQPQPQSQSQSQSPPEAPISSATATTSNWRSLEAAQGAHLQPQPRPLSQGAWLVSGRPEFANGQDHKRRQLATGELERLQRLSRTSPATVKARNSVASHLASEQQDRYESATIQPADAKTNLIQLGSSESGDNDGGGNDSGRNKSVAVKLIEVHTSGDTAPRKETGGRERQQPDDSKPVASQEEPAAFRSSPRGFSAINAGTIGD